MPRSRTLGQLYGVGIPLTEIVGVRILMDIEAPLYEKYPGLTERYNTTVTINALASDTVDDVMARAVAFAESGNLGARAHGQGYPAIVHAADLAQAYLGGYSNPTISMA